MSTARPRRRLPATLVLGIVLLSLAAGLALLSLVWLPFELSDTSGGRLEGPSARHQLGTDTFGRDLFSWTMVGTRIALLIGAGAATIALVLGLAVGLLAAFAPGWLDDATSSFLDVLIAFPTLLLAMLVVAVRSPSTTSALLSIGIASSAVVARLSRILAKRVLNEQFVTAARTSGTSWPRIVLVHLLPNMWQTLVVNIALLFGIAVITEAGLSYLGLGVPPPNASLGRLLQEAQATVLSAPLGAIAPGVVIVVIVLGANMLADGLRAHFDPALARNR